MCGRQNCDSASFTVRRSMQKCSNLAYFGPAFACASWNVFSRPGWANAPMRGAHFGKEKCRLSGGALHECATIDTFAAR